MKAGHVMSTVRVGLAEAIAETLLGGIEQCKLEGCPLSEKQASLLVRNGLLVYRSSIDTVEAHVKLDARISEIRPESRGV